jgi:hypothetical protein
MLGFVSVWSMVITPSSEYEYVSSAGLISLLEKKIPRLSFCLCMIGICLHRVLFKVTRNLECVKSKPGATSNAASLGLKIRAW